METIRAYFDMGNEWLTSQFGELAPMIVVGLLGVLLILVVLPALLKPNKDPFNKLRDDSDGGEERSQQDAASAARWWQGRPP
jgi:tight adherence protein C